jgi:hypothetical protein
MPIATPESLYIVAALLFLLLVAWYLFKGVLAGTSILKSFRAWCHAAWDVICGL